MHCSIFEHIPGRTPQDITKLSRTEACSRSSRGSELAAVHVVSMVSLSHLEPSRMSWCASRWLTLKSNTAVVASHQWPAGQWPPALAEGGARAAGRDGLIWAPELLQTQLQRWKLMSNISRPSCHHRKISLLPSLLTAFPTPRTVTVIGEDAGYISINIYMVHSIVANYDQTKAQRE